MMAESTSRPWSSVPEQVGGSPSASQAGGLKASISWSEARSNGLCGAIQGASTAPPMQISAHDRRDDVTGDAGEGIPDVAVEEAADRSGGHVSAPPSRR
jgi:hypothetical protein